MMKKQWQEFARDMEELEAEMEAMAKTSPLSMYLVPVLRLFAMVKR